MIINILDVDEYRCSGTLNENGNCLHVGIEIGEYEHERAKTIKATLEDILQSHPIMVAELAVLRQRDFDQRMKIKEFQKEKDNTGSI